jgi:hypothetical protein
MFNGSFSYKTDRERTIRLDANLQLRMARLDEDIARLFFVDQDGEELLEMPAGFVLRNAVTAVNAARLGNSFVVTWTASYILLQNDNVIVRLDNQKQQAFHMV